MEKEIFQIRFGVHLMFKFIHQHVLFHVGVEQNDEIGIILRKLLFSSEIKLRKITRIFKESMY